MQTSDSLFQELTRYIPGGVNSPFRAFQLVGGRPRVIKRGSGCRIWDVEDREYIDLCCAWGPLTLGHAHPAIVEAVTQAVAEGAIFGAPTPWELEMAKAVCRLIPSMQMVRFVNSGAEAVMSSLRVARSITGRPKIVKFEGCYHGHVPPLDAVGLEADELGGPQALGTTRGATQDTLLARFNDVESVKELFRLHPQQIACVILEPVTGSMGVIPARLEFLSELQTLCRNEGALLIFDEVLTGFRVHFSSQQLLGIEPDLTCLGKALAGGLPVGAHGGKKEYMERLSPLGPIYQAGTFCGNPITMRAGLAALKQYEEPGFWESLEERTAYFCGALAKMLPGSLVPHVGGMFSLGFGVSELHDHTDAHRFCSRTFAKFFHAALEEGVYFPPSTWDAAALSVAHSAADLDLCLEKLSRAAEVLLHS